MASGTGAISKEIGNSLFRSSGYLSCLKNNALNRVKSTKPPMQANKVAKAWMPLVTRKMFKLPSRKAKSIHTSSFTSTGITSALEMLRAVLLVIIVGGVLGCPI